MPSGTMRTVTPVSACMTGAQSFVDAKLPVVVARCSDHQKARPFVCVLRRNGRGMEAECGKA
ncbi:MAG: hypothetical protein QNJ43_07360 [Breoghania sp.]|nr:hypothetical protein [Breoghania sp.]